MMDLVYIVKNDERNDDLKYSLRSMARFYPDYKIWIVGYKPSWIQNVEYIPVKQTGSKWKNSVENIKAACQCEEISDDFILMNDDFFCIKPLFSIDVVANMTLGSLNEAVIKYKHRTSPWHKAFSQVKDLLKEIGVKEPYYNYEAHLPLQINRKKFLEVMALPQVEEFMKTAKVLHKRTLFKNYCKPSKATSIPIDVKLKQFSDDSRERLKVCGWISVYDGQVKDTRFGTLKTLLNTNFSKRCKYEVGFSENDIQLTKDITVSGRPNIPSGTPYKKKNFINY